MREYVEVPSVKHRLKISVEKIPYIKKKRCKRKTKEEILYDRAEALRAQIMTDKSLLSVKMIEKRTNLVYNDDRFKEIVEIGRKLRHAEKVNYLVFAVLLVVSALGCLLFGFYSGTFIMCLGIIPLVALFYLLFESKVKFRRLFDSVFLEICYYCANLYGETDKVKFGTHNRLKNWDIKSANKKIITNSFHIAAKNIKAKVEKMIVRNFIPTYKMKRGNIVVGKKLATIFSGYTVDLDYAPVYDHYDNDVEFAVIHKDTLLGTDGLSDSELANLNKMESTLSELRNNWSIYLRKGRSLSSRGAFELEKKIIMMYNALGKFNIYVKNDGVRMMLSVHSNKDGLKEEAFQSQADNPNVINYDSMYFVVKTLYIVHCLKKIVTLFYGPQVKFIGVATKEEAKRRKRERKKTVQRKKKELRAIARAKRKETRREHKQARAKQEKTSRKSWFINNRSGEIAISTSMKLVITVVLCSLILLGLVPVIENSFFGGLNNKTDRIHQQNHVSDTVTESDLA